jgi:hypothetical protein
MKKYLLAGILVLMMAVSGMAADYGAPDGKVVNVFFAPESGVKTLLNAATATGDMTAVDMGYTGKYLTCYSTWTIPASSETIYLLGSIDNSVWTATYDALATLTMASSPRYWSVVFSPFRHLKIYWTKTTVYQASSDLTVKCIEGGN